jgi:hypothetical protein
MATVTLTLTPTRQEALAILAAWPGGSAFVSQVNNGPLGLVGWQTAYWLRSQCLATQHGGQLTLTERGRRVCGYAGIAVAAAAVA